MRSHFPAFAVWQLVETVPLLLCVIGCDDAATPARALDAGTDAGPALAPTVIFEDRADGYPVFRIPALLETPRGTLLAFAEGRQSLQDDGNVDLVLRRSTDGGRSWDALRVVVDAGADTAGNPAPVVDRSNGRIWLPYCTNPATAMQQRSVWVTYSDDDGVTWSAPRDITSSVKPTDWTWYATGPGRSVQTASGRIVVPCDHTDGAGVGRAHVIFSDDHGATWQRGGDASPGPDESQVAELDDGTLLLASRDEGPALARAFSRSTDQGLHWSDAVLVPSLPDPHCEGSLLRAPSGLWMSNPATRTVLPRDHLTVRRSDDDGATWTHARLVEAGPSAYSSLAVLPDGRIALAWESGRVLPYDRIRFVSFEPAWVLGADP